jgi:hypothetical protein
MHIVRLDNGFDTTGVACGAWRSTAKPRWRSQFQIGRPAKSGAAPDFHPVQMIDASQARVKESVNHLTRFLLLYPGAMRRRDRLRKLFRIPC